MILKFFKLTHYDFFWNTVIDLKQRIIYNFLKYYCQFIFVYKMFLAKLFNCSARRWLKC